MIAIARKYAFRINGRTTFAVALSLVIILGLMFSKSSSTTTASETMIDLPMQIHDFGAMEPKAVGNTTFVMKNDFSDPMTIDSVDRSCGCTSARTSNSTVAPGGSVRVEACLTGHDHPEKLDSFITIRGHSGLRSVQERFELRGDVESILDFPKSEEGPIDLGSFAYPDLPKEFCVEVTRGDLPMDFDGLLVECKSNLVRAATESIDNNSWRLRLTIHPDGYLGSSGAPISIHLLRRGVVLPGTIDKEIYFNVRGVVQAAPSAILITAAPGTKVKTTITLSAQTNLPTSNLKVLSVENHAAGLNFETISGPGPDQILLSCTAPQTSGTIRGQLILSVGHGQQIYKIKLDVLALIY